MGSFEFEILENRSWPSINLGTILIIIMIKLNLYEGDEEDLRALELHFSKLSPETRLFSADKITKELSHFTDLEKVRSVKIVRSNRRHGR
jgi:hypothetical protein